MEAYNHPLPHPTYPSISYISASAAFDCVYATDAVFVYFMNVLSRTSFWCKSTF